MKIDLKNIGAHISIVNGYHKYKKCFFGRYWEHYKSDAVWTKCISLFFNTLN